MPSATRPSLFPDWSDFFRTVVPREWPNRLFAVGSEARADLIALGESLALTRDLAQFIQLYLWPEKDSAYAIFLDLWEAVFDVSPSSTTALRIDRLVATFRQRGTMTYALTKAILVRCFSTETDPSTIELSSPTAANVAATNTLGDETRARGGTSMHIYHVAETKTPTLKLAWDLINQIKPAWERWTIGKWKYGRYGSSASGTIRTRYNGGTYNTRP
jgi:hypothetical protein